MSFLQDFNNKRVRAWEKLYKDFYEPLCNYAMKILHDKELSEDVVSDMLMRLWEMSLCFDSTIAFTTYLYRTVHNNCLKTRLQINESLSSSIKIWEEGDLVPEADQLKTIMLEETVRKLKRLIDSMPEKRKRVMLLSLEEKTVEEIAELLMISPNTVKKHKKEAYLFIREMMKNDFYILVFMTYYPFL